MIRDVHPGSGSRVRLLIIPDPGVKKAPDSGSVSATLHVNGFASPLLLLYTIIFKSINVASCRLLGYHAAN
jgi:hypothetical protein